MKNIITNEEKQFIVVKVDTNGEPEGVLTRRTSRYGSNMAVSPFTLNNLSIAITAANTCDLQRALDGFLMDRKTYKYNDFRIVEMETKTNISFGEEVPINKEKERIFNNSRNLISMAKEWGIQWKKDNPDKDGKVWEGTPYNSPLVVNPSAVEYYNNKLAELNWKEDEDYSYSSQIESYENFVRAIN